MELGISIRREKVDCPWLLRGATPNFPLARRITDAVRSNSDFAELTVPRTLRLLLPIDQRPAKHIPPPKDCAGALRAFEARSMQELTTRVRPPLRWAGSKKQLLPVLGELWRPDDNKYIEAFAGSACLFFHLRPKSAVLNDFNADLISAYHVMATRPNQLYDQLTSLPVNPDTYYELRNHSPRSKLEAAVRFFYLNRFCFNGIYRTNKNGDFNVPFGRKTGSFPSKNEWSSAAKLLKTAKLFSGDFEEVVKENVETGDFVYLDPPYAVSNKRVFLQYNAREFGIADLKRLRSVMSHIDAKGAVFVVSYAQSDETAQLSKGWYSMSRMAQRNVAGFSKHRRRAIEVIITNDPSRLQQAV